MQLNFLDDTTENAETSKPSTAKKSKNKAATSALDLFGGLPEIQKSEMVKSAHVKPEKSPTALKTISEAADEVGVEPHVLRFWESRFSQIRPLKMTGGRRFYRPEDMDILGKIKNLLYKQGYTIKGAKKVFSAPKIIEQKMEIKPEPKTSELTDKQRKQITAIYQELLEMQGSLKAFALA